MALIFCFLKWLGFISTFSSAANAILVRVCPTKAARRLDDEGVT
jgi:hypothetical protein